MTHKFVCIVLPRNWHRFSHSWVSVQIMVPEYVYRTSVNFWSQKEMVPIILVAVMEHLLPTSPSYNGTSWIDIGNYNFGSLFFILPSSPSSHKYDIRHVKLGLHSLHQCFSTARPRPGTRSWHQLYGAVRGSPGICHLIF
jgi:hypothetical protein